MMLSNVQYECLNAKDDYAAQMKKGENVGFFSNWDIYDSLNSDLVNRNFFEGDDFAWDTDIINGDNIGPKTEKWNRDMLHIEQIMQDAE